ncbi:hypothetical protein KIN20_003299 [Parelaphostrongylus tenuis]|uniref:Dihydroorotate dehydrogenase (quinone), mitochondrial n=1 Tax=Parelaphostrongylus tenuis TaxID=148309 RepID=A0AAD5M150_PARTN|nr:hypothetical protein KIN20_003299 [Parelaphostrongylus tenuis]
MFSKLFLTHLKKPIIFVAGSGLIGCGTTEFLLNSEKFHSAVFPLIHQYIDDEAFHCLNVQLASWGLLPRFGQSRKEYPELECDFFGKRLKNPIGLAAGFDKNGEAIRSLAKLSGFGFIEIGTVTPIPEQGSPRPRLFRLIEDEGVINRCGFNNDGVGRVQQRVKTARANWRSDFAVLGVNVGESKKEGDAKSSFEMGVNSFAPYSDYIVLNLSSPNTSGLKFKKSDLQSLLLYVKEAIDILHLASRPKVFLKIPPDLTNHEKRDIAEVVTDLKHGVDGLIISNTTISRPETLKSVNKAETGELSGTPLRQISTECVREMYRFTGGQVSIIGCGGISSGADVYEKIRAGASVVQLHSAIVFHGFPIIGKIKRELMELLRRDGFTNITQAIGADHRI